MSVGRPGKLIFVNRYFYPDHSATSQLLTDLGLYLTEHIGDREIHIVTSRQLYQDPNVELEQQELHQGIHIHRVYSTRFGRGKLLGRSLDYLTFYLSSLFYLIFNVSKEDQVIAKTDPPLISVIAAIATRLRGAEQINWMQDMFPEIATALDISIPSFVTRLVTGARNWSLRVAKTNVVLGSKMADKLVENGISRDAIRIIDNWTVSDSITPVDRSDNRLAADWGLQESFVVEYSGNMGRAHEYDTILDAARRLRSENIVFLFIGSGALMDDLKQQVSRESLHNCQFKPYQDQDRLAESLSVGDAHLISLLPELEGLIVPSKLYGILGVGRPVIFIGSDDGEIARYIDKYGFGVTVGVHDGEALAETILRLRTDSEYTSGLADNSLAVSREHLSRERSLSAWHAVLTREN